VIQPAIVTLFDLSGRTALVTGGNSGIGAAMARALGLAGARVILVARRETELQTAARLLAGDGIEASHVACDLADPAAIASACAAAGAVDILVNAAGINLRQPFMDVTADAFDRHIAVHLRAPFLLTQQLAP